MSVCSDCIRYSEKKKKIPIRPFRLEYLALNTLLQNTYQNIGDNENEIQKNRKLFDTSAYKKLLLNLRYLINEQHSLVIEAYWLVQHFIQKKERVGDKYDNNSLISKVEPWCVCHFENFEELFDCCNVERQVKKKKKNGHYTKCEHYY